MDQTPADRAAAAAAAYAAPPARVRRADGPPAMTIDGRTLTTRKLVARVDAPLKVRITPTARRRAAASHQAANAAVGLRPVYGRTTGVGANREVALPATDAARHTLGLLRSHATSAGQVRNDIRIRAMLVVRLNQLAAGGSGISMAAIDGLQAMINADALPPIREHAGIGTGDLTAMATTALGLLGEAPLTNPLRPISLGIHDALPFLSSNAATLADAALAATRLQTLARAGLAVATLTGVAVRANWEAFGPAVARVTPGLGTRQVCRVVTGLVTEPGQDVPVHDPARIQDPFGMRCLPQVNGLMIDTLAQLDRVVGAHLNAAAENPVILAGPAVLGPDPAPVVAHHGGFHIPAVALGCDSAAISAAQSASLLQARLAMLVDPAATGLPPFLGDGTPGASGVMMLEYLAASAFAELRSAASPASLGSVSLSRGTEEHASFASRSAVQVLNAGDAYATALSCELLAAVRALRMQEAVTKTGSCAGWVKILDLCTSLGDSAADRDLTGDLATAQELLPVLADLVESYEQDR
ncbi:aromatic amino acid ammonia-lyase [Kineosporia mesophila]|uniref:Aromatic amino acid ammonia-lyase n=1 Tax=Kineosporia mesophila TaxID=566012 RepID=A0ABP7AH45_9ACTN|nr:aromatic amino acid lyase [Kineosporia mesophila]MCD5350837.1 aromatic amino acid lyase [Kineosporia mesophila]